MEFLKVVKVFALYQGVRTMQSPVGLLRKKGSSCRIFCMDGPYLFWPVDFLQGSEEATSCGASKEKRKFIRIFSTVGPNVFWPVEFLLGVKFCALC